MKRTSRSQRKRITHFIFLLAPILYTPAAAQNKTIDSLTAVLNDHRQDDTTKVALLNMLASRFWGTTPEKVQQYAQQALHLAKKLNYTKGVGGAYRELSRYYWTQADYDQSTDFALMAIREYERCSYSEGIAACYGSVAINYAQTNNYESALRYVNLALELTRQQKNDRAMAYYLNTVGYIHERKKDYLTAREYYVKALNLWLEHNADPTIGYANVGSINISLKDFPTALEYLFKARHLAEKNNNKNLMALVYQNIGGTYYETGKYDDSEIYLEKALKLGNEIGDKKRKEHTYGLLKDLEAARKNFKAAFHYLSELHKLRDTLYSEERSRQMARMLTVYETEKKEATIKVMAQEQRINVIWRNVLIAGVLLAGASAIVIFTLQRSRIQNLIRQRKTLAGAYRERILVQATPTTENSIDDKFLIKARGVVEANIDNVSFSVEIMAGEMNLSRAHLLRKLKALTGLTANEFIREIRLNRAADLLRQNSDTVVQIAYKVGFNDQSYFTKSFKKRFGMPPSEYANTAGKRPDTN